MTYASLQVLVVVSVLASFGACMTFLKWKAFSQNRISTFFGIFFSCIILFIHIQSNYDDTHWLHRLDFLLYDARFNTSLSLDPPETDRPQPIVILDIDEKSLAEQGRWPWSRHKLAQLLNALSEYQISIVGFDVVFSEPERNLAGQLESELKKHDINWQAPELWQQYVDGDQKFSDAIGNVDTVLGFFFKTEADVQVGTLPPPVYNMTIKQLQKSVILDKPGYVNNLEVLQNNAVMGGFVSTISDSDGSIRRSPLLIRHETGLYPSLGLATVMGFLLLEEVDIETVPLEDIETLSSVTLDKKVIRTDASGRVIVPYIGKRESYPYYSLTDVFEKRVDPALLEGAIALVGTSAIGLSDLRPTPMGAQYPGVEVHANIINALLNGDFPYRPDWHAGAILAVLIFLAALLSLWLPRLGPVTSITVSGSAVVLVIVSNYYLWQEHKMDLPLAIILLLILVLTAFNMAYGFLKENKNKRVLKGMFNQYVPPAHIERMLSDPDAYNFSGESKELSVLFSDIRSFTSISESLSATELKSMLNHYFTPITKVIFDNEGTIDKYVGDMVMAFWGAPIDDESHAHKSVVAALMMQEKTAELRSEFKARGWPEIYIGIGINTGVMNVGDMGSSYRRSYTVLGDAVNLGARLESITKFYGAEILIGQETYAQVPDIYCQFIDCIQVKGKEEPIKVYQPLGNKNSIKQEIKIKVEKFEKAYGYYLQQDWTSAENLLLELEKEYPNEILYRVYIDRMEQLKMQELPVEWDGVFRHQTK